MNTCTSDRCQQGRAKCPCPQACELPIQPGPGEIWRDRLDRIKHVASYAALIGGLCLLGAVAAFAFGRAYAG